MSSTIRVALALAIAAAAGVVCRLAAPAAAETLSAILQPIGTLWVNAIRMTVVPLVVALLVTSVSSLANAAELRALGGRTLRSFAALMAVALVIGIGVVPLLFSPLAIEPMLPGSGGGAAPAALAPVSLAEWIVGIVPVNPIDAAADGAMLPLVVFSLAFATALLTIAEDRRAAVVMFFRGVADAMLAIIRAVIALAPVGVIALVFPLVARTGLGAASALGAYILIAVVSQALLTICLYVAAVLGGGVSLRRFARAALPAQTVAVSTSSSLASLPAMIDGAVQRLGLPVATAGMVLPLSVSCFKVTGPTVWPVAIVFLCRIYGVPLPASQLVTTALLGVVGGLTAPGVPHGWLMALAPIAASLHIPPEGIGLLIAVDAIPDIFATLGNVTGDLAAATIVSRPADRND